LQDQRWYGGITVIGTRWHLNDLHGDLEHDPKYRAGLMKKAWHNGDGITAIWPQVFTPEMIEEKRTDAKNGKFFSCWYENDPMPDSARVFFPHCFRPFKKIMLRKHRERERDNPEHEAPALEPRHCINFIIFDPAFTEKERKKNCQSAFLVGSITPDTDVYIRNVQEKQIPVDAQNEGGEFDEHRESLAQLACDLMLLYEVDIFAIEDNNAQKWFLTILDRKIQILNEEAGRKKYRRPDYYKIPPLTDKMSRIRRMESKTAYKEVFCNDSDFISALCTYPQGGMKDACDCYGYIYDVLIRAGARPYPKKPEPQEWSKDPKTGFYLLDVDVMLEKHLKNKKGKKEKLRLCR
jgi:hypothetical protein